MENVFNPAIHKLVAIDTDGQHIHATLSEIKADLATVEAARPQTVEATAELERLLSSIPVSDAELPARVEKLEALVVSQERTIQTLMQRLDDIASAADKKLTDIEVVQSFIIKNALAKVELSKGAA
jgi:Tfp pilus assembly protein PilO